MKTVFNFILIFFVLIQSNKLNSQIFVGPRTGIGISYIKSGVEEIHNKFGYSDPLLNYFLSGFVNKDLTNKLNFNLEFEFSRKGYAYYIDHYFNLKSILAKYTMYATSLNLFIEFKLLNRESKKTPFSFGIISGLYNSLLFNNQWVYGNANPKDVNQSLKTFDLGYIIGFRLEKKHLKNRNIISIDIRYYQGLIDISKNYEQTSLRTFEIGIGYWFLLKGKRE